MTAPPTKNDDGQHDSRPSIWKNVLLYSAISLIMVLVFGTKDATRPTSNKSEADLKGRDGAAPVKKDLYHAPFAQRGDSYSITISSGSDGVVFAEDVFNGLVLDENAHDLSRNYAIDLQKCHMENCSAILTIKMSIRGKEYTQNFPLIRHLPFRRAKEEQHLFANKVRLEDNVTTNSTNVVEPGTLWKAYFQPSLTLSPIIDFSNPLPPQMRPYFFFDYTTQKYLPLLYINNFWVLQDHLVEVEASTVASPLNFTITISPRPLWKFALYVYFEESMKKQEEMGLARPADSDETKRIFLETNPFFLGITCIVTVLHMLFEYLAFSNDVKFWRHRKDFKGLSLRTIIMNCYSQMVIFLYLLDGDETSWTIVIPSGFGVLVEYWKLAQTVRIVRKDSGWWRLTFNDGYDRRTRKHDDIAVRYLMYAMTPILLGYSIYSALYNTHKSWYSFIIHTQVRFIYFFGFAMLTPQIFINYKMKTVAQLPWRTFVYRALNTVIDDLFAFIVKMPWLHRLACFRDDVVFAILLYQRWIYPVDTERSEIPDDEDDDNDNGNDDGEKRTENKLVTDKKDEKEHDGPHETKKKQ